MKIAIRADASLIIGSGHIMRCLTLADQLSEYGAEVTFLCRPHEGNLIGVIKDKGFEVVQLSAPNQESDVQLSHSKWLGSTQIQDAQQSKDFLKDNIVDWLIVDHYALDKIWQQELKPFCRKLMVIDDLGDREHCSDVLLDQNYGSIAKKYQGLVPEYCKVLAGTDYTLLRSEFANWRTYSLKHREAARFDNLLINLGGVDVHNHTRHILEKLQETVLPEKLLVTVVMGHAAPHLEDVKQIAKNCKYAVEVKTSVNNMAELMANADVAIGAAGSSTWERCCLGLPTIQMVTAENQKVIADALAKSNAVEIIDQVDALPKALDLVKKKLVRLSAVSAKIVDGKGAARVSSLIFQGYLNKNGTILIPYNALTLRQSLFVLKMRNHDEVRKWMHQTKVISESDHLSFVEKLREKSDCRFFMVQEKDKVIGTINFTAIDFELASAEFGIFANPFLMESGRGKKMMAMVLNYAKDVLKLRELSLQVFANNHAAIGLYRKHGFEEVHNIHKTEPELVHMKKDLTKSYSNEN